ncbi:MAG TPA: POTRA domain-containing protein [Pyrinomonadaceae bacterium]|jgi:outer membrane protein insertion porin family
MISHRSFQEHKATRASAGLASLFLILLSLLLTVPRVFAQQTPSTLQLGKIEFIGLQRHTQEEAREASGLQLGQPIDVTAIDAAGERLLSTGLYKNLSYKLHTSKGQAEVVFMLEEVRGGAPVVFDNFVWFTDEELAEAIRREVPSFDGTAPESGNLTETIARVLQRLLQSRSIAGQVEYTSSADMAGRNPEHIFSVKGIRLPICELHFPGASNVPESELIKNSAKLFKEDYSRQFVASFLQENLIPLYRERGHLRAGFVPAQARMGEAECKDGVALTMLVDEGPIYVWEKAEWTGNSALAVQELEEALGMRASERANGLKIDRGVEAIHKAYARRGYLGLKLSAQPEFDDGNRRVKYLFNVTEGPQYRMGTLLLTGLNEADAARLKSKWKLQPGDVFDDSYLKEFINKVIAEGRALSTLPKGMKTAIKPDRRKLTVDVEINFK